MDNHFGLGLCVRVKTSKYNGFFVFNNLTGNSIEGKALSSLKKDVKAYVMENYNRILEFPFCGMRGMRMYVLPSNFDDGYNDYNCHKSDNGK